MPTFRPPTVVDVPAVLPRGVGDPAAYRLFRHYAAGPRGVWVLKVDGTYATYSAPSQNDVDAATEVYAGAHVYDVSDATAAALTAAGYGDYLS